MAKKNKNQNPRLKKISDDNYYDRKTGWRDERITIDDKDKIVFSFKDFFDDQPKRNKQSFASWQKDNLLAKLLEKLKHLSEKTIQEAKDDRIITEYGEFPPSEINDFKCPEALKDIVHWSVIKNIHKEARVVGHIVGNIFYIVFFDKNHQFWKTEMKNT